MIFSCRFWSASGIILICALVWGLTTIQEKVGALGIFIMSNIRSNGLMCFLAPFIPPLAFSPVKSDDMRTETLKMMIKENSLKKYFLSKSISSMIAGSGVFLSAFLIILAGCFIINSSNAVGSYNPIGLFKEIYYSSPLLYIILFILHTMLFGALYAMFGMGTAIITKSDAMALVFPGIMYNCAQLVGMIFDQTIIYKIGYLFPFLTYEFGSIGMPLWRKLLDLSLVLIASILLIVIGYIKIKKAYKEQRGTVV